MNPPYAYTMTMLRWVDGDTFDADVDLGFHASVAVRFRLLDVDTPERGQPGFAEARAVADRTFPRGTVFLAQSFKGDKYGRWLVALPDVRAALQAEGLTT